MAWQYASKLGATIDYVPIGNVYPGYSDTLGQQVGGESMSNGVNVMDMGSAGGVDSEVMSAATDGNPAVWWLTLLGMTILLIYAARRVGRGAEYSDLTVAVLTIVLGSFASIVGIAFWKWVAVKVRVPGLSAVILST